MSMDGPRALARLTGAHAALEKAKTLSEVKEIIDIAEAAATYARAAKLGAELEKFAVEVKLLGQHKAGGMLLKLGRSPGPGRGKKERRGEPMFSAYQRVLTAEKIPPRRATEWQAFARVPAPEFAATVKATAAKAARLTTSAVRRVFHEAKRQEKATDAQQAIAEGTADFERLFKLQRYDIWSFAGLDPGYGKKWPGNLPAALVANLLYYFTERGDLVVDPMAGGGVTGDVCKALGRRVVMADLNPCRERADIQRHDLQAGPLPDVQAQLVFLDPPYWTLKAEDYGNVPMAWEDWVTWLSVIARSAAAMTAPGGHVAVLMQDNLSKDVPEGMVARPSILTTATALSAAGLVPAMFLSAPLSTQQVNARDMEWARHAKRLLGVFRALLIYGRPSPEGTPLQRREG